MKAIILLALLGLGSVTPTQSPAANYVVIANPGAPTDRCDGETVQRIFLGKETRWDDGVAIVPVVMRGGDLHAAFVEDALERSAPRYETYWKQVVFTGRGFPPRAFDNEQDLLAYVAVTPGAVGYVSQDTPRSGVKIIACDHENSRR